MKLVLFASVFVLTTTYCFAQEFDPDDPRSSPGGGSSCLTEGVVCPLTIDNVLDIDSISLMESASGCQYMCFREQHCQNFTFFKNSAGQTRCVLFRDCPASSVCQRCITGPARPTNQICDSDVSSNPDMTENEIKASDKSDDEVEDEEERTEEPILSSSSTTTTTTTTTTAETTTTTSEIIRQIQEIRRPKQFDDDAEGGSGEDGSDEAADQLNVEGIDDGLLDDTSDDKNVSNGETTPKKDREETTDKPGKNPAIVTPAPVVPTRPEKQETKSGRPAPDDDDLDDDAEAFDDDYFEDTVDETTSTADDVNESNKTIPAFFHCIIGGYGINGPIPAMSHFGSSLLQRTPLPLLAPLPPTFPLGDEGVFGTLYSKSMYVCSPGAASTNDQFFSFFGGPTRSLFPGRCIQYNNASDVWQPFGTPMNTFRGGAAFTRMGKFIVASGGRRFPTTLNSIEVLNIAKPQKWRQLSRLTLPNPTYDHCVVAINKTSIFLTGGFGQESHAMLIDMRDKTHKALEPMKQPRRQHHCQKAQINGREGVIVAGGSSDVHPALPSVEFYDLDLEKWLNLGKLREPRRFPSILVMSNHLLIAGGETTDPLGRTVILDTVEALQGRRWIPLRQRLPEGRSRFVTQRIPKSFFF